MAAPIIRNAFNTINNKIYIHHVRFIHISDKVLRRGVVPSKLRSMPNETRNLTTRNKRRIDGCFTTPSQSSESMIQDDYHNFQRDETMTSLEMDDMATDFETDAFVEHKEKHTHRFPFEKMKSGDTQLGKVMTLVKSKQVRERTGKVLLEGKRLLTDAILAGAMIETIYFCRHEALEDVPVESLHDAKFVKVPQKDIDLWTDVVTPQGILAVCQKPDIEKLSLLQEEQYLPVTLICDNIREPGNLGALLRSAAAVNCRNVLVTKGCVEIWQPKVLRAGCGAHFRIPIQSNIKWNEIHDYVEDQIPVHVADGNYTQRERTDFEGNSHATVSEKRSDENLDKMLASVIPIVAVEPYFSLDWTNPCALVIGGESYGLSLEAIELCDEREGSKVFIPMANRMNSLNSAHAASIMLYEARRQLTKRSHSRS